MSAIDRIDTGLCLRVLEGAHQVTLHPLTRPVVSIGRATPETPYTESYLTFPEPTLSRLHAVLTWEAGAKTYLAHHRSQTNPTLLNGRALSRSQLLKPGDTLALGRLVVVLDRDETDRGPAVPREPQARQLTLNLRNQERSYVFPVEQTLVRLAFSSSRATADVSGRSEPLPILAPADNLLRLEISPEEQTATAETEKNEPVVQRRTELPAGTLYVPLRAGTPMPFNRRDVLLHQGYEIWLSADQEQAPGDGTLDGKPDGHGKREEPPEGRARLRFSNGAWAGAELVVPKRGSRVFDLGPGSVSFLHDPPFADAPLVRVAVQDEQARIRVLRVADDQFVDLDGELLFTGESRPLHSGSRLLLEEHEFYWLLPWLHSRYSRYRLTGPDGSHAIEKAVVRLGTAAHCEIRFDSRALAPVVGVLRFGDQGFRYEHRNISYPAKVDGVETSAGLEAHVGPGSRLELAPGVTITVEEAGEP